MRDFSDIAAFASGKGLGHYNAVIELMEKDGFLHCDEGAVYVYTGIGKDYGYSEQLSEIFDKFVEEFGDQYVLLP